MAVSYEWDMEVGIDEFGDIGDHDFAIKLEELEEKSGNYIHDVDISSRTLREGGHWSWKRLVLVRTSYDSGMGFVDREWAYVDASGNLPTEFDGGSKVPKRFAKEFEANRYWAGSWGNQWQDWCDRNLERHWKEKYKIKALTKSQIYF